MFHTTQSTDCTYRAECAKSHRNQITHCIRAVAGGGEHIIWKVEVQNGKWGMNIWKMETRKLVLVGHQTYILIYTRLAHAKSDPNGPATH